MAVPLGDGEYGDHAVDSSTLAVYAATSAWSVVPSMMFAVDRSRPELGVQLLGGHVRRAVGGQHPVVDRAPLHAEEG